MNKSEIRKKILKIRKQKSSKSLNINYEYLLKILRKNRKIGKVLGGYYPYNYEVDVIEFLTNLFIQFFIDGIFRAEVRKHTKTNAAKKWKR